MVKTFFVSIVFFLFSFQAIEAITFDSEADLRILECLASENFSNTLINYRFYGYNYPIRLIHNPNKEPLFCDHKGFSKPLYAELIVIAELPYDVRRHLSDMFPNFDNESDGFIISLMGLENAPSKYGFLKPVHIATTSDDYLNNEILTGILSSNTFINEVMYYQLDGEFYRIRILYNPTGQTFKSGKKFHLPPVTEIFLNWDKKYGIAADKKAPKDLIDYLSQFLNCSWREWYFDFGVYNGSYVEHREVYVYAGGTITTTYQLDTYFNWMRDFASEKPL